MKKSLIIIIVLVSLVLIGIIGGGCFKLGSELAKKEQVTTKEVEENTDATEKVEETDVTEKVEESDTTTTTDNSQSSTTSDTVVDVLKFVPEDDSSDSGEVRIIDNKVLIIKYAPYDGYFKMIVVDDLKTVLTVDGSDLQINGTKVSYVKANCEGKRSDGTVGETEDYYTYDVSTNKETFVKSVDHEAGWSC